MCVFTETVVLFVDVHYRLQLVVIVQTVIHTVLGGRLAVKCVGAYCLTRDKTILFCLRLTVSISNDCVELKDNCRGI